MSTQASARSSKSTTSNLSLAAILGQQADDRRFAIMRALCRLIVKQGASSSSFSDIAREAGMTASHLHYYYSDKDALLDDLYHSFSLSLISAISSTWSLDLPPEVRCKVIADNLFLELSKLSLDKEILETVVFEMIAYAVHNPRLRQTLQSNAERIVVYFRQLFQLNPQRVEFSSDESADIAAATWVGMLVLSYFYKPLNQSRAKSLFCRFLLNLGGFEDQNRRDKNSRREERNHRDNRGIQDRNAAVSDPVQRDGLEIIRPSLMPMGIAFVS
jgi:AcrR family transcriptional regulator